MAIPNPLAPKGDTAPSGQTGDPVSPNAAPLGGTREESMQRLQVGLFGIFAMMLLVGLASVIGTQADMTEQASVPDAAPTTEPTVAPAQSDPLVDAGVVPDIVVEASPEPNSDGPILPEQGLGTQPNAPDDTPAD